MKRRVFLAIIPALLVLSSCAGVNNGPAANKGLLVEEDTLAHEELFDNAEFYQPNIRKLDVLDSNAPVIGVQRSAEVNGKINIRLVAAIKVESEEALARTTAVWTRTIYDGSGNVVTGKERTEFTATKAYNKINGGGDNLDITTFEGGAYSYFVVYTMMNVPVSGANDASSYYLNAFLTVDDESNNTFDAVSKMVSTTIDGNIKTSFDASYDYFLRGIIDGQQKDLPKDVEPAGENGNDHASFSHNFKVNDSFKLVINTPSEYKIIDASFNRLIEGGSQSGWKNHYFTNNNGGIKINYKGNYILYLNEDDNFYFGVSGVSRPLYVSVKDVTWWGDGRLTGIWAFNNDTNVEGRWFSLTKCSNKTNCFVTSEDVDASIYKSIDVVEMKAGVSELSWGNNNANVNNKTSDYDIPTNGIDNNCAYIWGNTNPWSIGWGTVPADNA